MPRLKLRLTGTSALTADIARPVVVCLPNYLSHRHRLLPVGTPPSSLVTPKATTPSSQPTPPLWELPLLRELWLGCLHLGTHMLMAPRPRPFPPPTPIPRLFPPHTPRPYPPNTPPLPPTLPQQPSPSSWGGPGVCSRRPALAGRLWHMGSQGGHSQGRGRSRGQHPAVQQLRPCQVSKLISGIYMYTC